MASLGGRTFNPNDHDTEQRDEYPNLPDGIYRLEVSEADLKEDQAAGKAGIKITYDVVEPDDLKGRKIFGYINIEHPNVQAQDIGQKELASLCRAAEISEEITDTDQLKFQSFVAKVGLGKPGKERNADGTPVYAAKNEIKRFYFPDAGDVPAPEVAEQAAANDNRKSANDNAPAGRPAANRPAAQADAAPKAARPWGKK
jgi:hypothetical protein